jgi:two-component system NtrC family sensor kinase
MNVISDHPVKHDFQENTILIVDDNPTNLELLSDYLEGYGFKIFVATNGELAVERAQYARPDLILLDVVMPGIDGFETCRQLKANEKTRDIPVVFMTALAANAEDKVKGFEVGAIDYITKPFYREEILARVTTHLDVLNLTRNLQTTNRELIRTLTDLKTTQNQLVESKKMAALGELVVGVAHELNTPLGVGITAASAKSLVEAYENGQMTQSTLHAYLNLATQSSQFILENLLRAADLVRSFKQIAVDQTNRGSRVFPVKAYIEGTLLSLIPKVKRTRHTLTIRGDDTISIDTDPGAFSQIIASLVMNSMTHAYQNNEHGHLYFDLRREQDRLIIEYSDDGCGIPAEHLSKIFDPFFTTARSRGGAGLGLYIVYTLVTQKLKGTIHCESQVGMGTKFILNLPLQ